MDKRAYISQEEMDLIYYILRSSEYDTEQKEYYKSRILIRLETLTPLVNECNNKGLSLKVISNDLNNEYNDLIFLRNNLHLYK